MPIPLCATISWVRADQFYQMPEIGRHVVVSDMEMLDFCFLPPPLMAADPLFVPKPSLNWRPTPNVGKSEMESDEEENA